MAQWVVSLPSRQEEALLHSGVLAHTCGPSAALEAKAGESEAPGHPLLGRLETSEGVGVGVRGRVKVRARTCSR